MAEIVNTLTIIFLLSSITLFIAKRTNHPAILGYITAGLVAGLFITEQSQLFTLVQLGIAFLVFIFGLKFDPEKISNVAGDSQHATLTQITILGTLTFLLGLSLGLDTFNSVVFALAGALSSSLVGIQLLEKEIDFQLIHGRLGETINLVQDFIAIIAIIILSTATLTLETISTNLGYGLGLLIAALVIRKYLMDFIAEQAEGSTELLMLISITILAGFISISHELGISIIVGSFAAGLAVAKYPHNLEILDTVSSLKDFFSAIFFVSLGTLLIVPNPTTLMLTLALIGITILVQPLLTTISLTSLGYDSRTSFATATSIDQISELVLALAIQLHLTNNINPDLFQAIVLATAATMLTSSYTSRHENKIYEIFRKFSLPFTNEKTQKTQIKEKLDNHVILLGYDIQGKRISELLETKKIPFIVLENDPEKIDELKKRDHNYIYGNALQDELWDIAEKDRAQLIISTAPFNDVSKKIESLETDAARIVTEPEIKQAKQLQNTESIDYVNVPEITSIDQVTEHLVGSLNDTNYKEELRRKNMLEIKKYLEQEEG